MKLQALSSPPCLEVFCVFAGIAKDGLINYIDTIAKCRHLKIMTCIGAHLCELLPLEPSLWFNLPPLFPVSKYSIYRQCVAGRGWGLLSTVGDHILQKFNTLYQTRFRIYKNARPPKKKPRRRGMPQTVKHLSGHLEVNFLDDIILLWCLY
jgi:hypothetical protein